MIPFDQGGREAVNIAYLWKIAREILWIFYLRSFFLHSFHALSNFELIVSPLYRRAVRKGFGEGETSLLSLSLHAPRGYTPRLTAGHSRASGVCSFRSFSSAICLFLRSSSRFSFLKSSVGVSVTQSGCYRRSRVSCREKAMGLLTAEGDAPPIGRNESVECFFFPPTAACDVDGDRSTNGGSPVVVCVRDVQPPLVPLLCFYCVCVCAHAQWRRSGSNLFSVTLFAAGCKLKRVKPLVGKKRGTGFLHSCSSPNCGKCYSRQRGNF